MARQPYAEEGPDALLRTLMRLYLGGHFHVVTGSSRVGMGTIDAAHRLCSIWNQATNPALYRSDDEASACSRIAWLCRRIRATQYSGRYFSEDADGRWHCPMIEQSRFAAR
jgi:hypothetical protein